ncbi:MAG: radical SAM family heme chaperone HemW [Synergistaceae bacterium]|jgi:oxygen-independent coproporphyrinogen-3 oxidase|nr:radical SAM family heme chaperone HemW [Synergistaceae bacterium]
MSEAASVYLHVPFCLSKCPYCAFASAAACEGDWEIYLRAASSEMERRAPEAGPLETLYAGGGTPSVLSPGAWGGLIESIEKFFEFSDAPEVTIEANPGSLTKEHLTLWRGWRVNRVSLGVQSLDDGELAALGRLHSASQAAEAALMCLSAGFSVSLDLMFGLPGTPDDLRGWAGTLRRAVALGPHHISVYQLCIEPGTPFGAAYADAPRASDGYVPYRYAQWLLPRLGYEQYEVASFALPGHESAHNLNYWYDGSYIGIGPSAWSCVGGVRSKNASRLRDYAEALAQGHAPTDYAERIEGEAAARQAAVLALRTRRGINWRRFRARYGEAFADAIRKDLENIPGDLASTDEFSASLSKKGLRLGNAIWANII